MESAALRTAQPLRYWIKHLSDIQVLDEEFDGFWMSTGYRIPDNACACVTPGTTPAKTVPIGRLNVRSFITSLGDGAQIPVGREVVVRGIAFDGGHGVTNVAFSLDRGKIWTPTRLGKDFGRYSFREWTIAFKPRQKGSYELKVRATNSIGEVQPAIASWNAAGYMRNTIESTRIFAV